MPLVLCDRDHNSRKHKILPSVSIGSKEPGTNFKALRLSMCCVTLRIRARCLVPRRLRRPPLIALCSLPRLSSRLCRHRRCLNLAYLYASARPQHLSHRLLIGLIID